MTKPSLLKGGFRSDCGLEILIKISHIRHILIRLVLCVSQRAIKHTSNQAAGIGNKKCYFFFFFFSSFYSSIALQPLFGPWLSRSSSSKLFSSLMSPSSSLNPFLHKCTRDRNVKLPSEHRFFVFILFLE